MIKKIFFVFFVFAFVCLSKVVALGVSPGVINLDFEPEAIKSVEFSALNYPEREEDVEVYVSLAGIAEDMREEFSDVVSLDKTKISFTKDIPKEDIKVTIKFPKGFSRAGTHELRVGVRPYVANAGEGFLAVAGNEVSIRINVSEKYVSPNFKIPRKLKILGINAKTVKKGEKAEVEIQVKSEVNEVLKKVFARVILKQEGGVLASAETIKDDIFPGETKTFVATFFTSDFPVATIPFDVEVIYGPEKSEKGTGTLTILEGEEASEIQKCKKYCKNTAYIVWIVILVIIILILLYLLFRRKGSIKGSYDFSSEAGASSGSY